MFSHTQLFTEPSNYPNCGLSFCPIKISRLYHSRSSSFSLTLYYYWSWGPRELHNDQLQLTRNNLHGSLI